jgi:hypothetical protein
VCATVTRIQVEDRDHSTGACCEFNLLQLERITARNRELACFLANPSAYPTHKRLTWMHQFDNCPSARYMLARHLPGIFSFEKGNSLFSSVEPNPKIKRRRKRRKIS